MTVEQMLARAGKGEILAVAKEGAEFEEFEVISSSKGRTGKLLIDDARQVGFRIFIDPEAGLIYDDIAGTIQAFGPSGRGELKGRYWLRKERPDGDEQQA
ncbi:hypothetical protein [Paenibacillus humicus]|uniref:hypothetical protein n=1 Tax=Paenibacillus humicus TaxID=412861 RepID=UPI003F18EA9C